MYKKQPPRNPYRYSSNTVRIIIPKALSWVLIKETNKNKSWSDLAELENEFKFSKCLLV